MNCLQPGVDHDGDTSHSAADDRWLVKLGYGTSAPGSGGTEIDAQWFFTATSGEELRGLFPNTAVYADITSGDNIYVSIAGPDTNEPKSVIVHAMEAPVASGGGSTTGIAPLIGGGGLLT